MLKIFVKEHKEYCASDCESKSLVSVCKKTCCTPKKSCENQVYCNTCDYSLKEVEQIEEED